jgi:hypothetical protein
MMAKLRNPSNKNSHPPDQEAGLGENWCESAEARETCEGAGGSCLTHVDGYYLESFVCSVIGNPSEHNRPGELFRLNLDNLSAFYSLGSVCF